MVVTVVGPALCEESSSKWFGYLVSWELTLRRNVSFSDWQEPRTFNECGQAELHPYRARTIIDAALVAAASEDERYCLLFIKALVGAGADALSRDPAWRKPLDLAIAHGRKNTEEYLEKRGTGMWEKMRRAVTKQLPFTFACVFCGLGIGFAWFKVQQHIHTPVQMKRASRGSKGAQRLAANAVAKNKHQCGGGGRILDKIFWMAQVVMHWIFPMSVGLFLIKPAVFLPVYGATLLLPAYCQFGMATVARPVLAIATSSGLRWQFAAWLRLAALVVVTFTVFAGSPPLLSQTDDEWTREVQGLGIRDHLDLDLAREVLPWYNDLSSLVRAVRNPNADNTFWDWDDTMLPIFWCSCFGLFAFALAWTILCLLHIVLIGAAKIIYTCWCFCTNYQNVAEDGSEEDIKSLAARIDASVGQGQKHSS
jgi:hypothetical protein